MNISVMKLSECNPFTEYKRVLIIGLAMKTSLVGAGLLCENLVRNDVKYSNVHYCDLYESSTEENCFKGDFLEMPIKTKFDCVIFDYSVIKFFDQKKLSQKLSETIVSGGAVFAPMPSHLDNSDGYVYKYLIYGKALPGVHSYYQSVCDDITYKRHKFE
jgi:hypothetical protein